MSKPPLSPHLLGAATETSACADDPGARMAMDLDAAELFVIASLRAWVAPLMRPGSRHPAWRDLFQLAGAGGQAEAAFDSMMSVIAAQAKRLIEISCCHCPSVGEDEAALLRLLTALQAADPASAVAILRDWLPEGALSPALQAASIFAEAIAEAGLPLPRRGKVIAFPRPGTLH